jgi:hypothetical protein
LTPWTVPLTVRALGDVAVVSAAAEAGDTSGTMAATAAISPVAKAKGLTNLACCTKPPVRD